MEQPVALQLRSLLLSPLPGLISGLLYDILRPLRQRAGKWGWLFDALFALCAGFILFALAMSLPQGRLGIWEAVGFSLGFWLYMRLMSPIAAPLFSASAEHLGRPMKKILLFIKNFEFSSSKNSK